MYRVRIGDCFLLTLEYDGPLGDGRNARHVLIDFGSFRNPKEPSFSDIATSITHHCQGKLDVIVASHRDKDHIAGFADHKAFQMLSDLSPSLVVLPWTDKPGVDWARRRISPRLRDSIRDKARPGVAERASRNLLTMASQGRVAYLQAGRALPIEQELPGTKALLLGPPERANWKGEMRSLNNTSLILFLTVTNGRNAKHLLFPGDAEEASWSRALERPESRRLLEQVDLYKIGHHGSAKATPPELLRIWKEGPMRPRVGLLSTYSGVFGQAEKLTDVPSRWLMEELRRVMNVVSTEELPPNRAFVEVRARVSGRSAFAVVTRSR